MKHSLLRSISMTATVLGATTLLSGCILDDIPLGTGYAAKYMCSGLWVSGLDEDKLKDEFIAPQVKPLPSVWKFEIDENQKTVSVRDIFFGKTYQKTAYYREGLGCTLTQDAPLADLDDQLPANMTAPNTDYFSAWPHGEADITAYSNDISYNILDDAIDNAFLENNELVKNTLSVAVVHNGQLIAERYAEGVDKSTRLLSWSMAKTISATVTGMLDDRGLLDAELPAPVAQWQGTDKAPITLHNMLQMASGISWNEAPQGDDPDQGYGLFQVEDMAGYYAEQDVEDAPNTVFNYSTGQSNLIAQISQNALGGDLENYYRFVNDELFYPLNINSAVVEFDTVGQPVGGAFHYLTTRDWARLGLLLKNDGNWFGQQIVSADWVSKMLTPSDPNSSYGYQTWLNTNQTFWPELPESSYAFRGFQGQVVMIIPDYDLVIVRTGVTFGGSLNQESSGISALALGAIEALQPL